MQTKDETVHALRILIVEDNEDFASLLSTLLGIIGHHADFARSGADGIQKAKELLPDIMFCDIGLPKMNGYEVAKNIRSEDALKNMFLIALTGYAGLQDIKLSKEAGFNMHLSKPINMETLKKVLAMAINFESDAFYIIG